MEVRALSLPKIVDPVEKLDLAEFVNEAFAAYKDWTVGSQTKLEYPRSMWPTGKENGGKVQFLLGIKLLKLRSIFTYKNITFYKTNILTADPTRPILMGGSIDSQSTMQVTSCMAIIKETAFWSGHMTNDKQMDDKETQSDILTSAVSDKQNSIAIKSDNKPLQKMNHQDRTNDVEDFSAVTQSDMTRTLDMSCDDISAEQYKVSKKEDMDKHCACIQHNSSLGGRTMKSKHSDDQTFPPNPGEKQNLLEQYEERTAAVRFEHRVLVQATAVNIVGERCNEDIKEILTKHVDNDGDVKWKKEAANHWHIGKHHLVMDPYEKKSAYVGAYFFNLAANMPDWRDYPVLDVPERTTLGHKANHLFEGKNTESYYDTVNHPVHVHGDIVCLIAKRMTSLTEE